MRCRSLSGELGRGAVRHAPRDPSGSDAELCWQVSCSSGVNLRASSFDQGWGSPVPRYYFHLRQNDTLVSDDDGQELADLQAARIAAGDIADDVLNEYTFSGVTDDPGLQIEVFDELGQTVVIVPIERGAKG